jgi:hypothetical protein
MRYSFQRDITLAVRRGTSRITRTPKLAWPVPWLLTALGACASGPSGVEVSQPPPPPPVNESPTSPRPGFVWAPGYWSWQGGTHVWVPGRWIAARAGQHWVADQWTPRDGRWYFEAGHWAQGTADAGVMR